MQNFSRRAVNATAFLGGGGGGGSGWWKVGIVEEDSEDYQRDVVVVSQTAGEGQGGVVLGV